MAQTAANKRRSNMRFRYGLSPETFAALFAIQGGKCAICEDCVPLSIDHCHRWGYVRGLLCGPCNKALGAFGDDAELVRRAIVYLGGNC